MPRIDWSSMGPGPSTPGYLNAGDLDAAHDTDAEREGFVPSRLSATGLRSSFVPKWKPNTAYAQGEAVVSPAGQLVTANAAFTSGASYVAANWTVTAGGAGGSSYTDAQATTAVASAATDQNSAVRVALDGIYGPASDVLALKSSALRVVYHGANAAFARPATAGPVLWAGTVQPANMAAGDMYASTSATPAVQPWTPASIPTLAGWYDPSVLSLADGAALTTWADKSPSSRTVTPNGEAPTFSAAGLGGKPAVNFGTATVGTLDSAVFGTAVSGPVAFFLNYSATDVSVARNLVGGASSTDFSIQTRTSGAGYTARRTNVDVTVTSTVATATPYTLAVVFNGATSAFYINGASVATGTAGVGDLTKLRLGRRGDGQNRHAGLLGDVFWMTGVPDASTIAQASAFLAARRGA